MEHQEIMSLVNKQYPMNFEQIELLRDGPSYVCTVSNAKNKFVIKIYRNCLLERGMQSIEIMTYLSRNGYPIPSIIPTKDGLTNFLFDSNEGKRMGVLYNFVEGIDPYESINAEMIGRQVAEMHNLMHKFKGKLIQHDKYYFIDFYISKLRDMGYPEKKIEKFSEHGDMLWRSVKKLSRGFCHGDLHTGNILLTPLNKYVLLDFDLASFSFSIFDIMTLCDKTDYFDFQYGGFEKVTRMIDSLCTSYTKCRHISDEEISAIYNFIAVRHYQLQAQIIDLYGLDCVDEDFIDNQYDWLMKWHEQCERAGIE
jgi:Ser/Thr protein kinase RdoA (MazF antagonist)